MFYVLSINLLVACTFRFPIVIVLEFLRIFSESFDSLYPCCSISTNSKFFKYIDNSLGISCEHVPFQTRVVDYLEIPWIHIIMTCTFFPDCAFQRNTMAIIARREVVVHTIFLLC